MISKNNETGRPANVIGECEDAILMDVDKSREISVRKLRQMYFDILKSFIWNILHRKNLYPCHLKKVQVMYGDDFPIHFNFFNRW